MAGIDRELLNQIHKLLRPIANRAANIVARAVVHLADDGTKLQLLQVGALAGETIDGAEHHQPYGFSSVPLGGAECVVVFPNGDRSHPLVIATSDRRYRPTGGQPGQVTMYHQNGAKVTILQNGNVEVHAGPGAQVLIDDGSGVTEPLVKRSEFNAHTHAVATTGTSTAQTGTAAIPTAVTGTAVLKAK